MKTLKSIILSIRKLLKNKAKVRTMKPNYSKEVNRLLAPDEDQVILDEHETHLS